MIGQLVGAWCDERGVDVTAYGAWLLESKDELRGVEPDECFVMGDVADPKRPDLAIEVVWTSGGIDKLEIYRALGVGEVWFWKDGEMKLFALRDGAYVAVEESAVLVGIDLALLLRFVDVTPMTRAIREFRAALRG